MMKDKEICFTTSAEVKDQIEELARLKGQDTDALLEYIVVCYLDKYKGRFNGKEKRSFPRCDTSIPVVVQIQFDNNETHYRTGEIMDISMGGVRISLPKHDMINYELIMNASSLEILFKLPEISQTITFKCEPRRMSDNQEALHLGASFLDADIYSQQALHKFVV
jgi:hypothetical protein